MSFEPAPFGVNQKSFTLLYPGPMKNKKILLSKYR